MSVLKERKEGIRHMHRPCQIISILNGSSTEREMCQSSMLFEAVGRPQSTISGSESAGRHSLLTGKRTFCQKKYLSLYNMNMMK